MSTLRSTLGVLLFVASTVPTIAQREYPATATIRGENIWVRVDPAEDTEIVSYLQRGEQIRVTGDATSADGDAFYPIEVVETGDTGWVRDLAIDPRSFTPLEALPEVNVDEPEPEGVVAGDERKRSNQNNRERPNSDTEAEQAGGVAASIDSGGLGLTVDEFHARYGTGEPDILGEVIETGNGRIVFMATEEGKVDFIERYFNQGVSFEDARFAGRQLAPADAVLLETSFTQAGSTVDLFHSPSLEAAFPPAMLIDDTEFSTWTNGEPGQFTIGYGGYNPANGINEVTRIVMGLGNNP
jgi:hypothetical protein